MRSAHERRARRAAARREVPAGGAAAHAASAPVRADVAIPPPARPRPRESRASAAARRPPPAARGPRRARAGARSQSASVVLAGFGARRVQQLEERRRAEQVEVARVRMALEKRCSAAARVPAQRPVEPLEASHVEALARAEPARGGAAGARETNASAAKPSPAAGPTAGETAAAPRRRATDNTAPAPRPRAGSWRGGGGALELGDPRAACSEAPVVFRDGLDLRCRHLERVGSGVPSPQAARSACAIVT